MVVMSIYKVRRILTKYYLVIIGQLVYLDLKVVIVLKILFGVMKPIKLVLVGKKEIMQSVVVTHQTLGQVN